MQRKINGLMVLLSLIGGALGFVFGELLLHSKSGDWPTVLLVGLYIGIVALCIGLGCLIAELVSPRLSGNSWRQQYTGLSWKLLVPSTLIMLLLVGAALELVYELNPGGAKAVRDIVLVIDNSGSMAGTDPNNERYAAAKSLVDKLDSKKRVSLVVFNDEAELLQPFMPITSKAAKREMFTKIDAIEHTDSGTNIAGALDTAMTHIREQGESKRGTMVILLSDGFSEFDPNTLLTDYTQKGIEINTIGFSDVDPTGTELLKSISAHTGGSYYDVTKANELSFIFQSIYDNIDDRTLLTERMGATSDSAYYMIVRIVFFMLIGAMIGLGLGILFDNRYLARSFAIGGLVSGALAGVLLEVGLSSHEWLDGVVRLVAMLLLAVVMTAFTLVIPVKENGRSLQRQQRNVSTRGRSASVGRSSDNSRSF